MVANNWLKDILNLTIILGRLLPVQHVQLSLLSHGYVDRKTVQLYSSLQLVSFQRGAISESNHTRFLSPPHELSRLCDEHWC